MPTYEFRNKQTGEVTEHVMRIADLDAFKEANPHLERAITQAPAFTGDHISAVKKYDTGFKEVLQKIHERTPGSQLNKSSSQL